MKVPFEFTVTVPWLGLLTFTAVSVAFSASVSFFSKPGFVNLVRVHLRSKLTSELVSVDWWISGQPFLTGRGKLVDAVVNAIAHYNEIKPQLLTTGGTSDGRFIARMGAQVVELGPVNATIHKINECVNAADLQLLARMYQRIMEQLVA